MSTGNVHADIVIAFAALFCAVYCTVMGISQTVDGIKRIRKES